MRHALRESLGRFGIRWLNSIEELRNHTVRDNDEGTPGLFMTIPTRQDDRDDVLQLYMLYEQY